MSDNTVPIVVTETPVVTEEKKHRLNRKVVGGFAAGIIATVAAAFAVSKLGERSDSDETEGPVDTFETFVDTTDPAV